MTRSTPGVSNFGDSGTDRAFKESALEVVRYSSWLDPADGATIDISPGAIGNNALGSYEARGHAVNPVTGVPYPQNTVLRADFGRVMAEFWADGPDSETPPGHWNTLANTVADSVEAELRIGGTGRAVDRLEWDVKMYFALNGAMHGSAIAAWGSKVAYDYSRPISMIRYMGGLGQSSDESDGPSFHPGGLPLEPGLVEVITRDSTAPGQRHRHLASHVGEIAIQAWTPGALDADSLPGEERVAWHLATTWVPYQKETFVTPAFAAYVSGHSTFSRAGAEVLAALTGSEFFPGGLGFWTIPAGSLDFDDGPTTDITL